MSQLLNAKRDKSSCPASKRAHRNGRRNKSRGRNTRQLCLEGLEGRNLLSADASFLPVAIEANSPPQAMDDTYVMTSNQQLGSSVLANDIDAEGDTMTAVLMEPPAHGILVMQADGRFTYKPNLGFAGTDRFAYGAADGRAGEVVPTMDRLTGGVQAERADPAMVNITSRNSLCMLSRCRGQLHDPRKTNHSASEPASGPPGKRRGCRRRHADRGGPGRGTRS